MQIGLVVLLLLLLVLLGLLLKGVLQVLHHLLQQGGVGVEGLLPAGLGALALALALAHEGRQRAGAGVVAAGRVGGGDAGVEQQGVRLGEGLVVDQRLAQPRQDGVQHLLLGVAAPARGARVLRRREALGLGVGAGGEPGGELGAEVEVGLVLALGAALGLVAELPTGMGEEVRGAARVLGRWPGVELGPDKLLSFLQLKLRFRKGAVRASIVGSVKVGLLVVVLVPLVKLKVIFPIKVVILLKELYEVNYTLSASIVIQRRVQLLSIFRTVLTICPSNTL